MNFFKNLLILSSILFVGVAKLVAGFELIKEVNLPEGRVIQLGKLFQKDGGYSYILRKIITDHVPGIIVFDDTFGNNGIISFSSSADQIKPLDIKLQSNGKILVAGYAKGEHNKFIFLARFNSDGTLDISFGTDGKVKEYIPFAIERINLDIQSDKIWIAGFAGDGSKFVMRFYLKNGQFDRDYGKGGYYITKEELKKVSIINIDPTGDFEENFTSLDISKYTPKELDEMVFVITGPNKIEIEKGNGPKLRNDTKEPIFYEIAYGLARFKQNIIGIVGKLEPGQEIPFDVNKYRNI